MHVRTDLRASISSGHGLKRIVGKKQLFKPEPFVGLLGTYSSNPTTVLEKCAPTRDLCCSSMRYSDRGQ